MKGQLITDYYAYNDGAEGYRYRDAKAAGMHWVGDLAIHGEDVEIQGNQGAVLLDLVKGGVHFTCRIDVATGEAELSIDRAGGRLPEQTAPRSSIPRRPRSLRGPGTYDLRFSNCDDEVLLWVNDRLVEFDGPTTYEPDRNVKPKWSPQDAGDLEPAGLGAEGVACGSTNLQVLRDVYYVASSYHTEEDGRIPAEDDYEDLLHTGSARIMSTACLPTPSPGRQRRCSSAPRECAVCPGAGRFLSAWETTARRARMPGFGRARFPQAPPSVRRDLLTGKALLIYWPHAWRRPIPFLPNFRRMGLIR